MYCIKPDNWNRYHIILRIHREESEIGGQNKIGLDSSI